MNYTLDTHLIKQMLLGLEKQVQFPTLLQDHVFSDPERTITGVMSFANDIFFNSASEKEKNILARLIDGHELNQKLPYTVVQIKENSLQSKITISALICVDQLVIFVDEHVRATLHLKITATELAYVTVHVIALRNAHLNLYFQGGDTAWSRVKIITHLVDVDAQVHVKGLYLGQSESKFTCTTQQLHSADRTESSVVIKSLLADHASLVYKGLIDVSKQCNNIKAVQVNKNSLLSSYARCISIPMLQVQSKSVSCRHASATGPFETELVWYAQSRGIPIERAYTLMMQAFVADVVLADTVESVVQHYANNVRLDEL